MVAGSDSTGNTMRTIMYNLLTHPQTLHRLQDELFNLRRQGNLSQPFPAFKEVKDLPYLDACVWEALRLRPAFALPMERIIPDGGATICGQYFPAGTTMGMSAYVVNRHKPTFGEDVEKWRPERWVDVDPQQRQKMLASIMTVGRSLLFGFIRLANIEFLSLVWGWSPRLPWTEYCHAGD